MCLVSVCAHARSLSGVPGVAFFEVELPLKAKWNAENPNIQVTATKFDGKAQEMITKLETDVKANNAPCLAQLGYGEVPEMFVKGLT